MAKAKRKFVLIHKRAPGDITVLTALARDIHLNYPGEFEIDVDTTCMDLWKHNPNLTPLRKRGITQDVNFIKCQYGQGIKDQNTETIHFIPYFHRDFEKQTGIKVVPQLPYGDLHLSDEERNVPLVEGRHWLMISGGKSDFTAKVWEAKRFQEVVWRLKDKGIGVVQIGGNDPGHWQPPIEGTLNLIGQTNLRDFLRLLHHSDGILCGVTFGMHAAAALHRPCVCLAGGREAWWWEAYVNENKGFGPVASGKIPMPHRFLHTIGLLDCCQHHGCWRNKVVEIQGDKSVCKKPVMYPGQPVPLCLDMITVDHVIEAIMSYYEDNSLPPINVDDATMSVEPGKQMLDLFEDRKATATAEATPANPNRIKKQVTVQMPPGVKLAAKPEGRGDGRTLAVATAPGGRPELTDEAVLDHPDVGGKFTICILMYGGEEHHDLHRKCLEAIVTSVKPERMDLRIGSNALNDKSVAMIEEYIAKGVVTKHYRHQVNAWKYPVMREMFHDPNHPITTKWVLWFDDDSIADRTPSWLNILAQSISQNHAKDNAHMFGAKFIWTLKSGQREWMESRPWHRGLPWRMQNGRPSPNGNKIVFCTGGFWAITNEAIKEADVPDADVGHNGGDYTIGEQIYQAGFNLKAFNGKKQFIHTSSVPRRGETRPMPGDAGFENDLKQRRSDPNAATVHVPPAAPAPKSKKRPRIIELV